MRKYLIALIFLVILFSFLSYSLGKAIGTKTVIEDCMNLCEQKYSPEQIKIDEIKRREDNLKQCLGSALQGYLNTWEQLCQQMGKPSACALPLEKKTDIENYLQNNKEDCYKIYPVIQN